MPEFVVRCRKTNTDPDQFLEGIGLGAHAEYLPHIMVNALFLSKAHRPDVKLSLAFEETRDYSRRLVLDGEVLGTVGGHDEKSLLLFWQPLCERRSAWRKKRLWWPPTG